MDYGHPLRFGTFITPANADPQLPVELARLSERLGLDLVTFQDHPYQPRFLDTWTLLSYVAARTERIQLAPNVLNVPMRPPAVVARAAASLDLMAHGRVALGLGAGAFWDAMEAMGVERLTPGDAVTALREAMTVMRAIWSADPAPVSVPGDHHRLDGASAGPAPHHNIPVWIGAGKPRMLRLVGREADGWVVPGGTSGVGALRSGNAMIDDTATAAGRDPREIRRILNVSGSFEPGPPSGFLHGPAAKWVEELLPIVVEDGAATLILASDDPRTIEQFAAEVAPALREAVAAERLVSGVVEGVPRPSRERAARRAGIGYDAVPAALAEHAVEPGDARFATVRSTYMRGGNPGLVLRPQDADQVAAALAFARTQPVPMAVRSGGHGISGRSTNDGGIVIDLSAMAGIEVIDEVTRLVRIEAGARWGEVAEALHPYGWAITSGDSGGVGVGGLATTGGIGFLSREHGLTIDHVRAVEIVLADGTRVRASEEENADLFWGVRGAGFNFGIVTAFEIQADPIGTIGFAQLTYDATDVTGFLQRWGAAVEAAPRDLTSFLIMGRPQGGRVAAQLMTVVDSDDPDTIIDRLQPLAAIGPLVGQSIQLMPYSALVTAPAEHPQGQGQPVSRSGLLEHITPEFAAKAELLVASGATYFFQIRSMGGAIADVAPDATAFAHRSANFSVVALGTGRALDAYWAVMREDFDGMYLSFETDTNPERVREAYPAPTLTRLRDLKRRYDPDNVFRDNFNIAPAEPGVEAAPTSA